MGSKLIKVETNCGRQLLRLKASLKNIKESKKMLKSDYKGLAPFAPINSRLNVVVRSRPHLGWVEMAVGFLESPRSPRALCSHKSFFCCAAFRTTAEKQHAASLQSINCFLSSSPASLLPVYSFSSSPNEWQRSR